MAYVSPIYAPSSAIKWWYDFPRAGNSQSLVDAFDDDTTSYIVGLLVIPITLVVLTVVWFLLLLVCKCCCRQNFLGGKGFDGRGQGLVVRTTFLLCTIIIIIMCITFVTGADKLNGNTNTLMDSIDDYFVLVDNGIIALDNMLKSVGAAGTSVETLLDALGSIQCPNLPQEITDLLNSLSNALNGAGISALIEILTEFNDLFSDSFNKGRDETDRVFNAIDRGMGYFKWLTVPVIIITFLLACGAVFSWLGKKSKFYTCVQNYVVLPIFIVTVIIGVVLLTVLSISSSFVSDACLGGDTKSPEGTIKSFLDHFDEFGGSDILDYYLVDGCRGDENPFTALDTAALELNELRADLNTTVIKFDGNNTSGCDDLNNIIQLLNDIFQDVDSAVTDVMNAIDMISCSNINSRFVQTTHVGICELPNGATWVFSSLIIMWLFGLILLLTRSASQPCN